MHISEGILPATHATVTWALALPPLVWGFRWLSVQDADERRHRRTLASMSTALVFATTLLPIPVPIAGVTSHLCATPLLAIVLGPRAILLPTFLALAIQALFLAHGGITTLGANLLTLGVVGPMLAYTLTRGLRSLRLPLWLSVFFACTVGDLAVYLADALILGSALSGHTYSFSRVFFTILLGFAPAQVPLSILEGVVSAFTLTALIKRQAHLIPKWLCVWKRMPATMALLLFLLSVGTSCESIQQGVDEAVFEKVATQAGHPPKPWVQPSDEAVLAAACIGCFVAGFIFSNLWNRIRKKGPYAS